MDIEKIVKKIIKPSIEDEGLEMWVEKEYTISSIIEEMVLMKETENGLEDEVWEASVLEDAKEILKKIKNNQKSTKAILSGLMDSLIG